MASNTSSVFNDSPAETQPASSNVNVNVKVAAPAPVAAASTGSSDARSAGPVTPATSTASEQMKQLAPQMEPTLDDHAKPKDAHLAGMRFSRVTAVELDGMKASLTFRKSCLKRSTSSCDAVVLPRPDEEALPREHHHTSCARVDTASPPSASEPTQKNRRRCWECRAKVPLTAVTCRCGYTFCNKHRYAEEHDCRFNFKQAAKRKLEEENPRCVPSKVARIN